MARPSWAPPRPARRHNAPSPCGASGFGRPDDSTDTNWDHPTVEAIKPGNAGFAKVLAARWRSSCFAERFNTFHLPLLNMNNQHFAWIIRGLRARCNPRAAIVRQNKTRTGSGRRKARFSDIRGPRSTRRLLIMTLGMAPPQIGGPHNLRRERLPAAWVANPRSSACPSTPVDKRICNRTRKKHPVSR